MPKQFIPRTKAQNAALHKLLGERGFTADDKAEMVFDITSERTEHSSEMSFDECNLMITRLGGQAFPKQFQPRRTANYHRQQNGVDQIVTAAQLGKLKQLMIGRKMTDDGLKSLCRRMLKDAQGNPLEKPRTTAECNKIIEAIKAMNKRDRASKGFKKQEAA